MVNRVVVVIDDDWDTLEYVKLLLASAGYHAVVSQDDEQAVELIRREQPAVVILDLQMRQREVGWLILEELRADPRTATIPVVVYSCDHELLRAGRKHDVDTLCKPFEPDELVAKVAAAA